MHTTRKHDPRLRAIAVYEGSKGLLTLLAGFGILTLLHRDVEAIAATVIRSLHLNPDGTYPALFLNLAGHVTDDRLWMVFAAGLLYSLVRFIEAFGLWHERGWAEWFGALSGGIYIPFEAYEIALKPDLMKIAVLLINLLIVGVLLVSICQRWQMPSVEE